MYRSRASRAAMAAGVVLASLVIGAPGSSAPAAPRSCSPGVPCQSSSAIFTAYVGDPMPDPFYGSPPQQPSVPEYHYSFIGPLPPGISGSPIGPFTGTFTEAGTFTFSIQGALDQIVTYELIVTVTVTEAPATSTTVGDTTVSTLGGSASGPVDGPGAQPAVAVAGEPRLTG